MRLQRGLALALVAGSAACASVGGGASEPAAPAWSPVGTWSFVTYAQGMTVEGTVTITEEAGAYSGRISPAASTGVPPMPFESAELDGRQMVMTTNAMGSMLTMVLVFDGDAYEGSWDMAGDGGDVSGHRIN